MKKIGIIIFSILLSISVILTASVSIFMRHLKNDNSIDSEYAVAEFVQPIETRSFEFDTFHSVQFLNDHDPLTDFSKKTKLLSAIPNLKIVNSNEFRVEVTTNADVFDKLKIANCDDKDSLVVTFADDCYVPVHTDDTSYDYDTGLYVGFDKFEVTVYAPISSLYVDSKIILDYEAPKHESTYISFSYEGTEANIHGIDTEKFTLHCSGTSNIKLSGVVRGESEIMIFHDTKIDARNLITVKKDYSISSAFFGEFSYIRHNYILHTGLLTSDNLFQLAISAFLYIPPILWLAGLLICIFKKKAK